MTKRERKLPTIPRAIPRTGEDLARAARIAKASTPTPVGRPATPEDVQPAAKDDPVFVGVAGVPDEMGPEHRPGVVVVAQVPWR